MIIISGKSGQLGNSLILYASFLAFTKENHIKLFNPSFFRYYKYFEFGRNRSVFFGKLAFTLLYYFTRLLHKLKSRKVIYLEWSESVNLDEAKDLFNSVKFIQGWNFRGNKTLWKYQNEIRELFTPSRPYMEQLHQFVAKNLANKNKITIGLHIRRGDYSWFEGGKYFYSITEYNDLIQCLLGLFQNSKIQILICSNETLKKEQFIYSDIIFGPGHELLDLYSLTYCNYIIGPPSTYTMWASFYGNVPLYMLHDIKKPFTISDFKIQQGF